jgi:hypothetical protein
MGARASPTVAQMSSYGGTGGSVGHRYYLSPQRQQHGPLTVPQLFELHATGAVSPQTMVSLL